MIDKTVALSLNIENPYMYETLHQWFTDWYMLRDYLLGFDWPEIVNPPPYVGDRCRCWMEPVYEDDED